MVDAVILVDFCYRKVDVARASLSNRSRSLVIRYWLIIGPNDRQGDCRRSDGLGICTVFDVIREGCRVGSYTEIIEWSKREGPCRGIKTADCSVQWVTIFDEIRDR